MYIFYQLSSSVDIIGLIFLYFENLLFMFNIFYKIYFIWFSNIRFRSYGKWEIHKIEINYIFLKASIKVDRKREKLCMWKCVAEEWNKKKMRWRIGFWSSITLSFVYFYKRILPQAIYYHAIAVRIIDNWL